MALQTTFHWHLMLNNEYQVIKENTLDFVSLNNPENEESPQFFIPQLLQEVYYVDNLSQAHNIEPDGIAYIQDNVYDYLRVFHSRIVEILQSHHRHLIDEIYSEDVKEQLRELSGLRVGMYVKEHLSEPFLSRDAVYMIFNTLPSPYRSRLPHFARRDIISSYKCFEKYWNMGISFLCEMQKDIHTLGVDELKNLLLELEVKNIDFKERYLGNYGGCFSLTRVRKNGVDEDVLCFSGQKFKGLNNAIEQIAHSGRFNNPVIIKGSMSVRYYICPERYVTFADARQTHKDTDGRMFSCCERKTFAEYDWHNVESYIMIVKYQPCELCHFPVREHTLKYKGKIRAGVQTEPLKEKSLYDAIAEQIYNDIH